MNLVRPVCARCRRPEVVCYCAHMPALTTRTRVVILQHPRESKMPVGTARMAHVSLPGSQLHVGVDFSTDPDVAAAIAGPATYVVFPHASALDVRELPPGALTTLVVLDGTWSQAAKLLKRNPAIAALPRVAFAPRRPSQYKIRREPAEHCVSTIEALAEVLEALEPDRGPFTSLLDPFHAMVETQLRFQVEVHSCRHKKRPRKPREPRVPLTLLQRLNVPWERLLCIQGEANAWPVHDEHRQPSEIVHWAAWRPSTNETYEAIIAPRNALAPSTPHQLAISAERLNAGMSIAEWQRSWAEFSRPDDLLLQWGTFAGNLALGIDLPAPARSADLRAELPHILGRRVGSIEDCLASLAVPPESLALEGRAGHRLTALAGVLRALWV